MEQIPGKTMYKDLTQSVINTTFHASFNIPLFEEIWNLSGYPAAAAKAGKKSLNFSHDHAPRAKLFNKLNKEITDLER